MSGAVSQALIWLADLGHSGVVRLGVEYQPIVSLDGGEIVAYEALARFAASDGKLLSNTQVFAELHCQPDRLLSTELQLKLIQLQMAPSQIPMFINLDPHILGADPLLVEELLMLLQQRDIVVELIENTSIHDARAAPELLRRLQARQIEVALDDIGACGTLLSLDCLAGADYLKFDRAWLQRLRDGRAQVELLEGFVRYARAAGKRTVLEGVETSNCLELARQVGVDFVQGYYYQDSFIVYHGSSV